ncbi:hypothetical protein OAH23_01480 [Verrucomicrobia bacterium]|nr:hypothetical protein [Verrucomicrobiota bacterium]
MIKPNPMAINVLKISVIISVKEASPNEGNRHASMKFQLHMASVFLENLRPYLPHESASMPEKKNALSAKKHLQVSCNGW